MTRDVAHSCLTFDLIGNSTDESYSVEVTRAYIRARLDSAAKITGGGPQVKLVMVCQ